MIPIRMLRGAENIPAIVFLINIQMKISVTPTMRIYSNGSILLRKSRNDKKFSGLASSTIFISLFD